MAASTNPIFTRQPQVEWVESVIAANTNVDITSGTSYLVFTADATEGSWLEEIRVKANPAANTAATVVRFWLVQGDHTAASANSSIIDDLGLPATTASNTAPTPTFSLPIRRGLEPGQTIRATLGTAPGGSGEFTITAFGGRY
jgi:hypothetical protein